MQIYGKLFIRERMSFLDDDVIRNEDELETDLYIASTGTHQYPQANFCHIYHSKSSIPYSQSLRLNRICSNNTFSNERCNELKSWLTERLQYQVNS